MLLSYRLSLFMVLRRSGIVRFGSVRLGWQGWSPLDEGKKRKIKKVMAPASGQDLGHSWAPLSLMGLLSTLLCVNVVCMGPYNRVRTENKNKKHVVVRILVKHIDLECVWRRVVAVAGGGGDNVL